LRRIARVYETRDLSGSRDDSAGDGQWTVVTARLGPCRGRRIIRGRETECDVHYTKDGTREKQTA